MDIISKQDVLDTIADFLKNNFKEDIPFEIIRGCTRTLFGSNFVIHNGEIYKITSIVNYRGMYSAPLHAQILNETEKANVVGALLYSSDIKIEYTYKMDRDLLPDDLKNIIKYLVGKYPVVYYEVRIDDDDKDASFILEGISKDRGKKTVFPLPISKKLAQDIIDWYSEEYQLFIMSTFTAYNIQELLNAKVQKYNEVIYPDSDAL